MKIETREDALLWCFDLWIDIAVRELTVKHSSYIWEWNGGELESCHHDCPCCEYAAFNSEDNCPISWPGRACHACENGASPYREWTRTGDPKAALQIATLALEALIK